VTPEVIAYVVAGAAAGGFITGLAGYGTALFALGFWLQVLPPIQAVAIAAAVGLITGIQGMWVVRKSIAWRRSALFIAPSLVGLPLGQLALTTADPTLIRLVIATLLLLNGVFFLLRNHLPRLHDATPSGDVIVGFAGGVVGGLAGIAGALPTMWVSLKAWPKTQHRALMQPFVIAILVLTVALMTARGAYTPETVELLFFAVPTTIISAQFGLLVFRRLEDPQFHGLVLLLLFFSGAGIMMKELL